MVDLRGVLFRICMFLTIAFAITLNAGAAHAEFPEKPITFFVHSKAGSGIDLMSRKLAQIASRYSDVPLVVENHTGGSGTVAMRKVLDRPADGYTLMAVTKSFLSTVQLSHNNISLTDFYFLACLISDAEALIVHRDSKYGTLDALIQDANEHPGNQKWLGPFVGGTDHLMAVRLWDELDLSARWIPYDSGSEAIAAIMGQHGAVYVGNPVDTRGRPTLKIIAVASTDRLASFPDVPTFTELGFPVVEDLWRGVAIRQNTPPEAIQWLEQLLRDVTADEEWHQFIESTYAVPIFQTHDEFTDIVEREQRQAREYLEIAGILSSDKQLLTFRELLIALFAAIAGFILIMTILYRRFHGRPTGSAIIAAALIPMSAFLWFMTTEFPAGKLASGIGPSTAPRMWILFTILFSVLLIIREKPSVTSTTEMNTKRIFHFLLLMTGYLYLLPIIGYFLLTPVFILAGIYMLGYRNHFTAIASTAGFMVVSWVAFYQLLQVPLPMGVLQ